MFNLFFSEKAFSSLLNIVSVITNDSLYLRGLTSKFLQKCSRGGKMFVCQQNLSKNAELNCTDLGRGVKYEALSGPVKT